MSIDLKAKERRKRSARMMCLTLTGEVSSSASYLLIYHDNWGAREKIVIVWWFVAQDLDEGHASLRIVSLFLLARGILILGERGGSIHSIQPPLPNRYETCYNIRYMQ